MKKILPLIFLCLVLTSCSASRSNDSNVIIHSDDQVGVYKKISAEDARDIIESEGIFTIVDVRTEAEYNEGHIENAILLTDTDISQNAESILTDKKRLILVYCRSGRRSKAAVKKLIKMGYTNVVDFGGIIDWPYDIVH